MGALFRATTLRALNVSGWSRSFENIEDFGFEVVSRISETFSGHDWTFAVTDIPDKSAQSSQNPKLPR